MAAVTAQHWARSRYPLHPSSQGSAPSSPTTSQSDEGSIPSFGQLLDKVPAPWYHAVTDDKHEPRAGTSQLGNSSHQPSEHNEAAGRSSVAFSMSQQSISPPSMAHDQSHQGDGAVSSLQPQLQLPSDSQNNTSQVWSRDSYPRSAIDETSPEYSARLPEEEHEHEHSPVQAPERTLRRTPRSRRITSPVQVEDVKPSSKPSADESSTLVSISNPWKRHGYPLHPSANDSTAQHPPPPYQRESVPTGFSAANSSELHPEGSSTEHDSWHRQLDYQSKSSPDPPVSPPVSDIEQEGTNKTSTPKAASTDQTQDVGMTAKPVKTLRRQAYPLQSPASTANLRRSPTPPQSSSESELAATDKVTEQTQKETKRAPAPPLKKISRRQPYPLQSPASTANIKGTNTPPPSPPAKEDSDRATQEPPEKSQQSGPSVTSGNRFRRQRYPLQSPASIPALRHSPSPEMSSKLTPKEASEQASEKTSQQPAEEDSPVFRTFRRQGYPLQRQTPVPATRHPQTSEKSLVQPSEQIPETVAEKEGQSPDTKPTDESRQDGQAAPSDKPFQRQAYPLQSPVSHAKLVEQPTLSSSQPQPENESRNTKPISADQARDKPEQAESKTETPRRQGYPLQAPIDVPALHVQSQKDEQSSANKTREHELASKVVNQWRRQMYPLQSPNAISPFERPTTPQPPEEKPKHDKPKKIHLPKNIRAVKDANDDTVKGRTIVVCLDGTGDKFDNDNSNIVHLISALKKDDPHQVTYYQAGIGTYSDKGLSSGVAAAMDMAVGSGLGLHVRDAYHFLMHSYKEGDKICIFGFSRGAYTARCLAGMIHKVGLLPPRNIQQIQFAYQFYADTSKEGWTQSEMFKSTFSIDVCVYLLGCFDSVASVGFIPRQLPLSSTPSSKPRYFRHAMALDERRAKFKVCRHQNATWDDIEGPATKKAAVIQAATEEAHKTLPNYKDQDDIPPGYHRPKRYGTNHHPNVTDEEYEELKGNGAAFDTDVLEVWFAGAHADIGGGAVPNDERHKLAHIPLRWMIRQAFECNTGIIFKTKVLAEHGLDIHTLWPKYERLKAPEHEPPPSILEKYQDALPPRHVRRNKLVPTDRHAKGEPLYHLVGHEDEDWTPELVEDFYDAMSPLNDQLIQAPTWWVLEFMPVEYKVPIARGEVQLRTGMNWGQYRGVEDLEPNLHWTVRHRVRNTDYRIRARTAAHTTWRVVV